MVALVFEYINGFHDTANSIATVVSHQGPDAKNGGASGGFHHLIGAPPATRSPRPFRQAWWTPHFVTSSTIICALLGGIVWNPSPGGSAFQAAPATPLIGASCGATLASANGNWNALIWSRKDGPWYKNDGLLYKGGDPHGQLCPWRVPSDCW